MHLALAEATDRRRRSGPPRVASGRGGAGTGRGGRAASSSARPAGRRRAAGCAAAAAFLQRAVALTRRPGAARGSGARRRRRPACGPGRSMRRSGCWPTAEAGPLDELERARVDLLRGRDRVRPEPRQRRSAAAARRPRRGSSRSTCASRARPTWTRGARRCSPARLGGAGGSLRDVSPRRGGRAATAADPPRRCDLLLDGFALIFTEGARAAAPALRRAVARVRGRRGLRRGGAPLGLAGDARRAELPVGRRRRGSRSARAPSQLARDAGRARGARRRRTTRCGQAVAFGGDFARAALADRGGRRRQGGDRDPHRARTPRSRSRDCRGRRGRGVAS